MINFRPLSDDHHDPAHSPLLRAALLTLQYTQEHGAIGLTQTKAFKRVFVHWAVEHFDWPGSRAEEMFRYNKVINEYEFPPLDVLHYLLINLRPGRHFKGVFRLTKRGADLAQAPAQWFAELIPFYVLKIDHASYARFEERPFGKWEVWMNVIDVDADHGTTERALFAAFYREEHDWDNAGWREMAVFSSCVLRPLEWAGLLIQTREERDGTVCLFATEPSILLLLTEVADAARTCATGGGGALFTCGIGGGGAEILGHSAAADVHVTFDASLIDTGVALASSFGEITGCAAANRRVRRFS